MAVFAYRAIDASTSGVTGTLAADTPRQARDSLRARGLTIQELAEVRSPVNRRWSIYRMRRSGRRHEAQVLSFVRELSTLLGVGIPLLEAIDSIARQHRGAFGSSLLRLRERVSSGVALAQAMAEQRQVFDDLTIQIIEVGENAGTLDAVLDRLADFKERSAAMKNRVATAMVYPAIVLCMGIGISIFLMTFVVPNLLTTLLDADRPPPLATRIVKACSDFLLYRWWVLLSVLTISLFSVTAALHTRRGLFAWHRSQLRIPLIGELIRKQAIVRIAVVISTLLKSGIVFVRAVHIAQRSTRNLVIRDALQRCETAVASGRDIARSLEATGAFPPLVVQIFSVGQQSGQLEEMLERLANDYDRQVNVAATRLNAVLEPMLIVFLAVIVGFIAFATVMPILEASDVF